MANDVFANGREIACKAADGKSIAAFPDTCMTPPECPATPPGVPVPYPNTAFAKDTAKGSKNVKISGKEVMLKNKSYFKKSTGDEAGCAQKKGVITSKITGKVYFASWSDDVKIEGQNVVRHLDLTTHNHACVNANEAAPWTYIDSMVPPPKDHICHADIVAAQEECKNAKKDCKGRKNCKGTNCAEKMECILPPKGKDKEMCCKPNNTGDHLIEDHWIRPGGKLLDDFSFLEEKEGGPYKGAPTMCVNRSRFRGKHGIAHGVRGVFEYAIKGELFDLGKAKKIAIKSHKKANPHAKCSKGCVESQLDSFYGKDDSKKCQASNHKQPLKEEQRKKALNMMKSFFKTLKEKQ